MDFTDASEYKGLCPSIFSAVNEGVQEPSLNDWQNEGRDPDPYFASLRSTLDHLEAPILSKSSISQSFEHFIMNPFNGGFRCPNALTHHSTPGQARQGDENFDASVLSDAMMDIRGALHEVQELMTRSARFDPMFHLEDIDVVLDDKKSICDFVMRTATIFSQSQEANNTQALEQRDISSHTRMRSAMSTGNVALSDISLRRNNGGHLNGKATTTKQSLNQVDVAQSRHTVQTQLPSNVECQIIDFPVQTALSCGAQNLTRRLSKRRGSEPDLIQNGINSSIYLEDSNVWHSQSANDLQTFDSVEGTDSCRPRSSMKSLLTDGLARLHSISAVLESKVVDRYSKEKERRSSSGGCLSYLQHEVSTRCLNKLPYVSGDDATPTSLSSNSDGFGFEIECNEWRYNPSVVDPPNYRFCSLSEEEVSFVGSSKIGSSTQIGECCVSEQRADANEENLYADPTYILDTFRVVLPSSSNKETLEWNRNVLVPRMRVITVGDLISNLLKDEQTMCGDKFSADEYELRVFDEEEHGPNYDRPPFDLNMYGVHIRTIKDLCVTSFALCAKQSSAFTNANNRALENVKEGFSDVEIPMKDWNSPSVQSRFVFEDVLAIDDTASIESLRDEAELIDIGTEGLSFEVQQMPLSYSSADEQRGPLNINGANMIIKKPAQLKLEATSSNLLTSQEPRRLTSRTSQSFGVTAKNAIMETQSQNSTPRRQKKPIETVYPGVLSESPGKIKAGLESSSCLIQPHTHHSPKGRNSSAMRQQSEPSMRSEHVNVATCRQKPSCLDNEAVLESQPSAASNLAAEAEHSSNENINLLPRHVASIRGNQSQPPFSNDRSVSQAETISLQLNGYDAGPTWRRVSIQASNYCKCTNEPKLHRSGYLSKQVSFEEDSERSDIEPLRRFKSDVVLQKRASLERETFFSFEVNNALTNSPIKRLAGPQQPGKIFTETAASIGRRVHENSLKAHFSANRLQTCSSSQTVSKNGKMKKAISQGDLNITTRKQKIRFAFDSDTKSDITESRRQLKKSSSTLCSYSAHCVDRRQGGYQIMPAIVKTIVVMSLKAATDIQSLITMESSDTMYVVAQIAKAANNRSDAVVLEAPESSRVFELLPRLSQINNCENLGFNETGPGNLCFESFFTGKQIGTNKLIKKLSMFESCLILMTKANHNVMRKKKKDTYKDYTSNRDELQKRPSLDLFLFDKHTINTSVTYNCSVAIIAIGGKPIPNKKRLFHACQILIDGRYLFHSFLTLTEKSSADDDSSGEGKAKLDTMTFRAARSQRIAFFSHLTNFPVNEEVMGHDDQNVEISSEHALDSTSSPSNKLQNLQMMTNEPVLAENFVPAYLPVSDISSVQMHPAIGRQVELTFNLPQTLLRSEVFRSRSSVDLDRLARSVNHHLPSKVAIRIAYLTRTSQLCAEMTARIKFLAFR